MLAALKVNGANILTATDTMFELRLPNDVTMEYQKFRPWYATPSTHGLTAKANSVLGKQGQR